MKIPVLCGVFDGGGKTHGRELGAIEREGFPGPLWFRDGNYDRLRWDERDYTCPEHGAVQIHEEDLLHTALNPDAGLKAKRPGSEESAAILTPSDYEVAREEAVASVQGRSHRVLCGVHGTEIGAIHYTPVGRLFWADPPVARNADLGIYLRLLKKETGKRPPPPMSQVRVLIERIDEAEAAGLPPMAWCAGASGHRLPRDLLGMALRRFAVDPSSPVAMSAHTARIIIKSV